MVIMADLPSDLPPLQPDPSAPPTPMDSPAAESIDFETPRKKTWNRIVSFIQLCFIPLALWWLPYKHLPFPGYAGVFIAIAAAFMTVHEMRDWQKFVWMILIAALLAIELRAISKDRTEAQDRATADRNTQEANFAGVLKAQDADFGKILDAQEKDFGKVLDAQGKVFLAQASGFKTTADGLAIVVTNNQKQFDASLTRSEAILAQVQEAASGVKDVQEEVTGGGAYAYFELPPRIAAPGSPRRSPYGIVRKVGTRPLYGVTMTITSHLVTHQSRGFVEGSEIGTDSRTISVPETSLDDEQGAPIYLEDIFPRREGLAITSSSNCQLLRVDFYSRNGSWHQSIWRIQVGVDPNRYWETATIVYAQDGKKELRRSIPKDFPNDFLSLVP
jgi:hypothetical protein